MRYQRASHSRSLGLTNLARRAHLALYPRCVRARIHGQPSSQLASDLRVWIRTRRVATNCPGQRGTGATVPPPPQIASIGDCGHRPAQASSGRPRPPTRRSSRPSLVCGDLLKRDHHLSCRRAHLGALRRERKLVDIFGVHLGNLHQCGASVLAEIQDHVRGVPRLVQARDSIDILPAHRSDRGCRGRLQIAGCSRPSHKCGEWRAHPKPSCCSAHRFSALHRTVSRRRAASPWTAWQAARSPRRPRVVQPILRA